MGHPCTNSPSAAASHVRDAVFRLLVQLVLLTAHLRGLYDPTQRHVERRDDEQVEADQADDGDEHHHGNRSRHQRVHRHRCVGRDDQADEQQTERQAEVDQSSTDLAVHDGTV